MTGLPLALSQRIGAHTFAGELGAAGLLIDELQAAAEATSAELLPYGRLVLAAWQGREAEAGKLVEATTMEAVARGDAFGLVASRWASAVLWNGLGRYDDALAAAELAAAHPEGLAFCNWSLSELVEAGVRSGHADRALAALERLSDMTRASGTDWALGIEACSRALMSDGKTAEGLYRQAIEQLGRSRVRVQLARAHLLYGEWLRRGRRRRDARGQLRIALELFTSMGTEAFAGRAERELLATGERVPKRTVETREQLTTQEAQVARLARDGLSNVKIGGRLFISQHTVAYHLRKVFSKLDITSRHQLDRVLPDGAGVPGTA
jgi:DNA-binding CsgD family transcriptional regulator